MSELELGNGQYLVGKIVVVDDSFTHEFGIKNLRQYQIRNLEVWVDVMGSEIEISKNISERVLERFKELWVYKLENEEVA